MYASTSTTSMIAHLVCSGVSLCAEGRERRASARHEKAAHLSAGAPTAAIAARRGVLLFAGSGGAAAAAADLPGRPDIVHCVRGSPSRPPAGCGNVQDSDDDGARKQRGDRCRGCPAAAVKPFCMHDRGKFDSQSKIQSGSAFLSAKIFDSGISRM